LKWNKRAYQINTLADCRCHESKLVSFAAMKSSRAPPPDEEVRKEIEEAANMQMMRIQEDQERETDLTDFR
jgi:hypothetical protein